MLFAGEVKQDWQFKRRITPRRRFHKTTKDINKLRHIQIVSDLRALLEHRGHDRIVETYLREQHLIKRGDSTSIGEDIELTFQERFDLGITTIRPFDITWRECRRRYKDGRNARKRNRAAVKRREAGMRPWIDSLSRTKPWESEGISRSTWYKRRKTASDKSVPPPSLDAGLETDCPSGEKEGFAVGASPTTEPIAFHFFPDHEGVFMKELRPRQANLVADLRSTVSHGVKRIMVCAPCGFGKTLVSSTIINGARAKNRKVAFVVDAISLIDQTVENFWAEGIRDMSVLQGGHLMADWSKPVQICSIATLDRRESFPEADIVIIDEAHRLHQAHKKWIEEHPETIFIGLSATPGTKGLGKYFDTMLVPATTQELIDEGYLSPFRVMAASHPDLSNVPIVAGDYHEGKLSQAMTPLTADIIQTYKKEWGKGKTLCFAVDRAHAKSLQERFQYAGIKCDYQDKDTDRLERQAIRRRFHSCESEVVVNVGTLTTGVDWDVRCLILARPSKSRMLISQIIGRALRTADGKEYALILDHTDVTEKLGFITDFVWDELDNGEPKKKSEKADVGEKPTPIPVVCDKCSFLKPAKIKVCPNCGHQNVKLSSLIEREGELIEITPHKIKKTKKTEHTWTTEEKRTFLAELKAYAAKHEYKPGWCGMKYRQKFGQFPPSDIERVPPAANICPKTMLWIRSKNIAWSKSKHNPEARA